MDKQFCASFVVIAAILLSAAACSRTGYISEITDPAVKKPADTDEIYYSNYFSFHGEDEHGRVLFAIDNNRWKRGDTFGAEHFLAMYADSSWKKLKGKGKYDNNRKQLVSIPSSKWFSFIGSSEKGLTIISQPNDLTLVIDPLTARSQITKGYARFGVASAPATMIWRGREIRGRVIQEKLRAPEFSKRLKQFLTLGGGSFSALYLNVGGRGDLYLHKNAKEGGGFSFITGFAEGFLTHPAEQTWNKFETETIKTDKSLFFSFPLQMNYTLSASHPKITLQIHTVDLKTFSNLLIFGFAMGYVEGTLTVGSQTYAVFGFSELIAT